MRKAHLETSTANLLELLKLLGRDFLVLKLQAF